MDINELNRKSVEEENSGLLIELKGSKSLLVSFGGLLQGFDIPAFEFFNSVSSIDCDKVFVRDFKQCWYQAGIDNEINSPEMLMSELQDILLKGRYQKVCFLGNSMGGYAAILFGSLLQVNSVLAFSPQTFIDRWNRLRYLDRRWPKQISRIYRLPAIDRTFFDLKKVLAKHSPLSTHIRIYYTRSHRLDSLHAKQIGRFEQVCLEPVDAKGHGLVRILRDRGMLATIIQKEFD